MTCTSVMPESARPLSSSHPRPPAPSTSTREPRSFATVAAPGSNSPLARLPVSLPKALARRRRGVSGRSASDGAACGGPPPPSTFSFAPMSAVRGLFTADPDMTV